jgi:hypothetical protein
MVTERDTEHPAFGVEAGAFGAARVETRANSGATDQTCDSELTPRQSALGAIPSWS